MKNFYTFALMSALALSASPNSPAGLRSISHHDAVRPITARSIEAKSVESCVLNPAKVSRSTESSERLSESFEACPTSQSYTWLPEGWTRESKAGEKSPTNTWFPYALHPSIMQPADGMFVMGILPSAPQDEWLITPCLDVKTGDQLSFSAFYQSFFFFDSSQGKFDSEKSEFIGERELTNNFQVYVRPEGGEWTEIFNAGDEANKKTTEELIYEAPSYFWTHTLSLADWDGKKVHIAFRYVGTKSADAIFLDKVRVGLPVLDKVAYSRPWETLFWGYDRQPGWVTVEGAVAHYPAYTPITWTNTSPYYSDAYKFAWEYNTDFASKTWVSGGNGESLTVTYATNPAHDKETANNFYFPPRLTASAPGYADGTYSDNYLMLQAGGKPTVTTSQGDINMGLLPFSPATEGLGFLCRELVLGETATVYFGKSAHTDAMWFNMSFPGEDPATSQYDVYVDGVLNFLFPSEAPLVVNGAHLLAHSSQEPDAELTLELYSLGDDFVLDLNDPEAVKNQLMASATCKGSDFILAEGPSNGDLATIPFDFETPVVLDNTHTAYVVLVRGFHSEKFHYFAAMQSIMPHPDEMNFGYALKHNHDAERGWLYSLYPLAYIDGDNGPCYNSFAINLMGCYPWLESETSEVEIGDSPVTVLLDSYYPAEQLSLSNVAGLDATLSGRFGKTELTLSHNDASVIIDGDLEITAPGVRKVIKVKEVNTGIENITGDNTLSIEAVFTLAGQRVNPEGLAPGIYIARYTDGTSRKIAVK